MARDRDLFLVYREGLMTVGFSEQREAAEWAVRQPARSFYISLKPCYYLMNGLLNGRPLKNMHGASLKKVLAMFDRFVALRADPQFEHLSVMRLCERLIEEKAPEFYIEPDTAEKVIRYEIQKYNNEIAKRIWR